MTRLCLCLMLLTLLPAPALAHKVIAGVFASGPQIEGELGFSNGDMAAGQEVIVYDPSGAEIGRTVTDADGFFLFTPTQPVAHRFRADLGAGHVADVTMPAADVAAILGVAAPAPISAEAAPPVLTDAQRAMLAELIRTEIRPLRRELAAYKERTNLQSILGGLGYIAGLFGLGFYLAARRKLSQ